MLNNNCADVIVKLAYHLFKTCTDSELPNIASNKGRCMRITSRLIYPFLIRHINKNSNDRMISVAYWLTDYLDITRETEKASVLAKKLIEIIPDHDTSGENIRRVIGSYYSVFKNPSATTQELEIAESAFCRIETQNVIDRCFSNDYEKLSLKGIFESNYGALFARKALLFQDQHYLDEALAHHERALAAREKMIAYGDDNEAALYTTKSNIAGIYYKKGMYRESLLRHTEVLNYQEKQGKEEQYTTKRLMLGCYCELWKSGKLRLEEKEACLKYIDECKKYFQSKNIMWQDKIAEIEEEIMSIKP